MGTRTDQPITYRPVDPDARAAQIRHEIDTTRRDMTRTVNEIETRLSPAHLKEQTREMKEHLLEEFHDAKERVKGEVLEDLEEAKEKVKETIYEAKMAVREATVGKVENMMSNVKETAVDTGTSIVDTVKANPIPAALIAVGVGWLLMSGRKSTTRENRRIAVRNYGGEYGGYEGDYEYGLYGAEPGLREEVGGRVRRVRRGAENLASRGRHAVEGVVDDAAELAHDVGDRVGNVAHRAVEGVAQATEGARERVGHLAHDAGETVTRVAHNAQMQGQRMYRQGAMQVRRAERVAENAYEQNPLAMGAVALAIGAAIGLAIPTTRKESEILGPVRDKLIDRAQGMARETLGKVENAAGNLQQVAGALTNLTGGQQQGQGSDQTQRTQPNGVRPNGSARI